MSFRTLFDLMVKATIYKSLITVIEVYCFFLLIRIIAFRTIHEDIQSILFSTILYGSSVSQVFSARMKICQNLFGIAIDFFI